MNYSSIDNFIRCSFGEAEYVPSGLKEIPIQLYYGRTEDLLPVLPILKEFLSHEERLKSDKFHFETDRNTYILCHSLIRKILSGKLMIDPSEITIIYDGNNKPWLKGNPLFFNLSHTKEAFAFAVSDTVSLGVDMEDINRNIDFKAVVRTFFSIEEEKYILEEKKKSRDRFFLLWTRKEALLKALGTGLIDNLQNVEVFRKENYLKRETLKNILNQNYLCDHFIYSMKTDNNYLSVALPAKAKITLNHLTPESMFGFL